MKKLESKDYIHNLLKVLEDNIDDLQTWSAYNDDAGIDQIGDMNVALIDLKKEIDDYESNN